MTAILLTLVIVVLATVASASMFVAVRASRQRDAAKADLSKASDAVTQYVVLVANHNELKGLKMDPVRKDLLETALKYYQDVVQEHLKDEPPKGEVAAAYFHIAGLQAKLGLKDSTVTLNQAMLYLQRMMNANLDAESYPSLQKCAMKVAAPNEWMFLKRAGFTDIRSHSLNLYLALQNARLTFKDLSTRHPESISLRDDYAVLLSSSAVMQAQALRNHWLALTNWTEACKALESLVRDEPNNVDFKARLGDAYLGAGRAHKSTKDDVAAIASYQRGIQIKEQLAQADPKDEALAKQLKTAKDELAKLEAASANAQATAAKPDAAAPANGAADDANAAEAKADPDASKRAPDAAQAEATPAESSGTETAGDAPAEKPVTP
jgi:eukaryotic-like serine/threonine-protein kinase